jgi:hypothetical protein
MDPLPGVASVYNSDDVQQRMETLYNTEDAHGSVMERYKLSKHSKRMFKEVMGVIAASKFTTADLLARSAKEAIGLTQGWLVRVH